MQDVPEERARPQLAPAESALLHFWRDAMRGADGGGLGGAPLSWQGIESWLRLRGITGADAELAVEVVLACKAAAAEGSAKADQDRAKSGKG